MGSKGCLVPGFEVLQGTGGGSWSCAAIRLMLLTHALSAEVKSDAPRKLPCVCVLRAFYCCLFFACSSAVLELQDKRFAFLLPP